MDEHSHEIDDVAAVAEHCRITHTYLCRLFRDYADSTPQQYLQRVRIRMAADELCRGEASIADLARMYGYSDQFAFSRAFKRVMGEAPTAFRARYR